MLSNPPTCQMALPQRCCIRLDRMRQTKYFLFRLANYLFSPWHRSGLCPTTWVLYDGVKSSTVQSNNKRPTPWQKQSFSSCTRCLSMLLPLLHWQDLESPVHCSQWTPLRLLPFNRYETRCYVRRSRLSMSLSIGWTMLSYMSVERKPKSGTRLSH